MTYTKHATTRSQQRGIPAHLIRFILEFGTPRHRPGGAIEYWISKKDIHTLIRHLKQLIKLLEKAANKGVLLKDKNIISVYHKK